MGRALSRWLSKASTAEFSAFAIAAAFTAYFSMYAFRKPFAAAHFEGELWGIDLKTVLVISQICGYATSKFLGIAVVSERRRDQRAATLFGLIIWAELALLLFAIVPPGGRAFALFLNGLPLGMVWGLVFSYLEGRRNSEILGAGLSCSYIVASGPVKSVGRWLMDLGVAEHWMPVCTGALFLPTFMLAIWALERLPAPNSADQQARTRREPMSKAERKRFFRRFAPGLIPLTILYVLLTGYRDIRDNFAAEILAELAIHEASAFTKMEIWIAPSVLGALACIYKIHDNRSALMFLHALMLLGALSIALATQAYQLGLVSGLSWMTLVGVGLYLAYVPYGCVLFDRLIASQRIVATSVFLIYVTDAFGYLGSLALLIVREAVGSSLLSTSWLAFFIHLSWATALVCSACFVISWLYFARVTPRSSEAGEASPTR